MENPHVLEDIEEIVREEGIIERALKQWDRDKSRQYW